jgi:hypothetical protein
MVDAAKQQGMIKVGNFPDGLALRKGLKSAPFLRPRRTPKTVKKGAP